jgi:electron transport complex protein RnfG
MTDHAHLHPQAGAAGPSGKDSLPMIIVLGGITMLSGRLLASVYQVSKPYVEENQRVATQAGIFKVLHGAVSEKEFVINDAGLFAAGAGKEGTTIYAGYDRDNKLVGIAARSAARGYADDVQLLYGYYPDCQCIRAFNVLKSSETPGLGDKITTNAAFLKNFDALDAKVNDKGDALANEIVTVKHGTKKNEWEIDAISGATITSRAVGKAINISAKKLVPLLQRFLPQLQQGMKE